MLFLIRFIVIFALIVIQVILATLAIGNFASGAELGQFFAINAFACLFGILVVVFVGLLMITEFLQGKNTTTAIGFELLWSLIIWVASAVEASHTSSVKPSACLTSQKRDLKWDACATSSAFVSLSWVSMFFTMTHIAILLLVVEWHHNLALASYLKFHTSTSLTENLQRRSLAQRVSRAFTSVIQGEICVLFPILRRSAHVLLREKARGKSSTAVSDNSQTGFVVTGGQRLHLQIGNKGKAGKFGVFGKGSSSSSFACPSSPRFLDTTPYSPAPIYDVRPKFTSVPIDCHPDNIDDSKFVMVPETLPAIRIYPSTPRTGQSLLHSHEDPQFSAFSNPIPRTPRRALTLPSSRPRISQRESDPESPPPLSRSHTVTSTRRFIPSRYMGLDLDTYATSPQVHIPHPPVGYLPNPNGVYV